MLHGQRFYKRNLSLVNLLGKRTWLKYYRVFVQLTTAHETDMIGGSFEKYFRLFLALESKVHRKEAESGRRTRRLPVVVVAYSTVMARTPISVGGARGGGYESLNALQCKLGKFISNLTQTLLLVSNYLEAFFHQYYSTKYELLRWIT